MVATRESILASATKFQPVPIDVPALGGVVHVRPLTTGGMSRYLARLRNDPAGATVEMLIDAVCDSDGKRLFTADDAGVLADLPAEAAEALLNAIGDSGKATPKEAAKN